MKERPILFSASMVRAILEGRKTQTRSTKGLEDINIKPDAWERFTVGPLDYKTKESVKGKFGATFFSKPGAIEDRVIHVCPAISKSGQPGDRLWVRETWAETCDEMGAPIIVYRADNASFYIGDKHILGKCTGYWSLDNYPAYGKWKPSIFMPRWASRITLEITGVRAEKIQKITDEDVLCEGFRMNNPSIIHLGYQESFKKLWDSINGKKYSWSSNPYVWVREFKTLSGK